MPSHIFTRVGDWDASIAANVKSVATSRKVDSPGDELHADDYLTYAYLQEAQDQAAKRVLDDARRVANNPENVGASSMAGSFALAAIAARYVIEREAWGDAKALEVHPSPALYPEAMTRFVRAIGFAQTGDIATAKIEIAELEKLRDALVARKDAYWSEQVEIQADLSQRMSRARREQAGRSSFAAAFGCRAGGRYRQERHHSWSAQAGPRAAWRNAARGEPANVGAH